MANLNLKKGSFKYKIFLLFNTLNELKKSTSAFFFTVILIIESLQISYISFEAQFSHLWDTRLNPFIKILRYLYYGFVSYQDDFEYFKIYFFLVMIIIISSLILLTYIYYKISNNSIDQNLFFIFSLYVSVFNQILQVPFTTLLLSIVDCNSNISQIASKQCFTSETFFYYIAAIILLLIILIFGISVSLLNSNFRPHESQGKICSSNYEILNYLKKLVLIVLFTLRKPFGQYNLWILAVLQLLLTASDFIYLISERPYFDTKCFKVVKILRCLELFYAVIVFVCLFLGKNYIGHLYLIIIGITMIILINLVTEHDKFAYLIRTTNKIIPEDEVKKLVYFISLFENSNEVENYSLGRAVILLQENNSELLNQSSKQVLEQLTNVIEEANSLGAGKLI